MLTLDTEVMPAPAPGVRAFRDDARAGTFYLLPLSPAVSRDESGRAEFALISFGRKQDGSFHSQGALLTVTTTLQVASALRDQARRSLESRLGGDLPAAPGVELGAIDWLEGTVTVWLTASTQLTGRPSMTGANLCAFNTRLGAEAAAALGDALGAGLPDARIRYDMKVRAAGSPGGAALVIEGGLGLRASDLPSLAT